jgi:hypothetical protein
VTAAHLPQAADPIHLFVVAQMASVERQELIQEASSSACELEVKDASKEHLPRCW